jgi:hypothetical protein
LAEKQSIRKQRWDRLEQLAKARKAGNDAEKPAGSQADPDPSRMEALRLQDDPHRSNSSVSKPLPPSEERES